MDINIAKYILKFSSRDFTRQEDDNQLQDSSEDGELAEVSDQSDNSNSIIHLIFKSKYWSLCKVTKLSCWYLVLHVQTRLPQENAIKMICKLHYKQDFVDLTAKKAKQRPTKLN